MMLQRAACTLGASVIPSEVMRNLALGIMGSWALFMLGKSKLTAMKLGSLLATIISLGVMCGVSQWFHYTSSRIAGTHHVME